MNNNNAPVELGTKKVSTLLKQYAIPGIIAMTASSLYNMVDSIYIGHIPDVGAYAISGLAVTFPLMNLSTAIGTLVGVGASTMISILLGKRQYNNANRVLSNAFTLNFLFGLAFSILVLAFLEPILYFFGASENTMFFAKEYMTIILFGNVVTHLYFGLNNLIRASGNPKTAMGLTLFTVIFNSILDPIFIFTFGMGIKGAAIATVLCQFLALLYTLYFFSKKRKKVNVVYFDKGWFHLDWKIAKDSLSIGLGPFLMNSASCIVTMFINQQLRTYGGDLSIGAYGIVNRITFLFLMIVMGLCQGMQPIASYNWGARQYSRVRKVFYMTASWATFITILCWIVCILLPEPAVKIFTNEPELVTRASKALWQVNVMIPVVGFSIVAGNIFQCLGMVKTSIFLSLSRQILVLVPLLYLLPLRYAESGVWISFPISDAISATLAAICIIKFFGKLRKLKNGDDPSSLGGAV